MRLLIGVVWLVLSIARGHYQTVTGHVTNLTTLVTTARKKIPKKFILMYTQSNDNMHSCYNPAYKNITT